MNYNNNTHVVITLPLNDPYKHILDLLVPPMIQGKPAYLIAPASEIDGEYYGPIINVDGTVWAVPEWAIEKIKNNN